MTQSAPYHEAGLHLVLMAYLQRVINGGGESGALSSHASCVAEGVHTDVRTGLVEAECVGRIEREYLAASVRLGLLLVYGDPRMAIDVKLWNDKQADPLTDGLGQIERYLNRLGLDEDLLAIFDRRTNAPEWAERMFSNDVHTAGGGGFGIAGLSALRSSRGIVILAAKMRHFYAKTGIVWQK